MTDTLASRLIDAATAAGLTLGCAIDYADGHAFVHIEPCSMGEWQQWCDLVDVDGSTIRTSRSGRITFGAGDFGDYRITLCGHGVPALATTDDTAETR